MDDGAPTGPKTILRYFPERFRHHHADRIRHVRRPNTNKRTLAIRWRLGLTVCVWTCSRSLVCVRTCARVCEHGITALPIVGRVRVTWRKRELAVSITSSCGTTTLPARRAGECRRGNWSVLSVGSTVRSHISAAASLFTDLPRLRRSAFSANIKYSSDEYILSLCVSIVRLKCRRSAED
ncbi:hypothetical protein AGLY_004305 [Aphis glycines]|uniref:Uncharacterized protein n=1 Tax=Aphis glycines TaxID=307491 RepID=A0A6G0TZ23_APHGL|nr:hypothetical protein AGLY_004305 [Aphis glycines]